MTKMLEKVFKEASRLSDIEQNALARWLLEELEADRDWDKAFAESEDVLDKLADEALIMHKHGKTISWNCIAKYRGPNSSRRENQHDS